MNILIINSNSSLSSAVKQSISENKASISETDDIYSAVDELKKLHAQIVLINWSKADFDASTLIKSIKKLKLQHPIYTVLILERDNQKALSGIMDSGCDDFIFKPFSKEEMGSRLRIAERMIKNESNLNKANKKLIKFSKEDPITGLFNRRALLDEMLKEMGRASREHKFLSTIMVEMKNHKELIEEHGNMVGDMILVEFALRLKSICRPYDKLGRYGISTFMILLPDTGGVNAKRVADRIIEVAGTEAIESNGIKFDLKISVGISELDPEDAPQSKDSSDYLLNDLLLDSLVRKAEQSMINAEKKGGDSYERLHP